LGEAERLSSLALSEPATRPDALHLLGLTALARGEEAVALRRMREAVAADPANLDRQLDLGQLEMQSGELERAIDTFSELAQKSPDAAIVQLALGNALKRAGRFPEAIAAHERAVTAAPDAALCWSDLAGSYLASGEALAAVAGLQHATHLAPEEPEIWYNLGTAELRAGHAEPAKEAFEKCLKRAPEHARAASNLGVALKSCGRADAALEVQRRAMELAEDDPEVQWNLALTEMSLGLFEEGWARYEHRKQLPGYPALPGEAWDGSMAPEATLVLHAEQGLGDTFMFLRFVAGARARVRRAVLSVPAKLVRVLREGFPGDVEVVAEGDFIAMNALHARLPSLPHLLGVGGDFAVEEAYLDVPAAARERLAERLPTEGLRVGLAWQGNASYRADHERSIPLSDLEPALRVAGTRFVSLQKHDGVEQLKTLPIGLDVLDLGSSLDESGDAFAETAAALKELDLLLTSDSAIAHLAGALGVETWLLLAHAPDFRWGYEGTSTAWYPTMRVFRQRAPRDWSRVAERVASALRERVEDA